MQFCTTPWIELRRWRGSEIKNEFWSTEIFVFPFSPCFPKSAQTCSNLWRFFILWRKMPWLTRKCATLIRQLREAKNWIFINVDDFCRRKYNQKSLELLKNIATYHCLLNIYHYKWFGPKSCTNKYTFFSRNWIFFNILMFLKINRNQSSSSFLYN